MFAGPAARSGRNVVCAGFGVVVFACGFLWCWMSRDVPAPTPDNRRSYECAITLSISNPGYTGIDSCAKCHVNRVAEFQQTRHFLAMRQLDLAGVPAGFNSNHEVLHVPELSLQFDMRRSTREFVQSVQRQTETGPQGTTSPLAFAYGSNGGNDEVYFTWHEDRLYELPIVWVAPLNRWGTSPFDRHGSGDYSRETTPRCVECHNTWFEHVPGSRNQYGRDNYLLGVTCEVCHGPGREHVAFHEQFRDAKVAHAVVKPAELPRERLMDLCAYCHSNAIKHRGRAFRYRPGEILDDYYYTIHTKHPEDDHVANQTTYLRQSRCFLESESMTCVTCHNPHRPRSESNAGAGSCRQCHKPEDCTDRHRLPVAVQDDCAGCHMPERRKIQVFFRTQDDSYVAPVKRYEHRIAVYPDARLEVLLKWHRTQSDLASHEEADRLAKSLGQMRREESEQCEHDFRFLAAIDACRDALKFDPDEASQGRLSRLIALQTQIDADYQDGVWHERNGRYDQAIESFLRLLASKPNHVMAHAKLGTTYAIIGKKELAVRHLQSAAELDPDEPYAPAMLGWLAYLNGRPEEALEYYHQADKVEPYDEKINHQMGLTLAKLDRWSEASERFAKALEIDPKAAASAVALSQSLRRLDKPEEALQRAEQAVQLTKSRDAESLMNLAECHANLARWSMAAESAERALAAVHSKTSQLSVTIRRRLQDYRNRQRTGR